MENFLEIGKIINKRGIRGELKVEPYSNSEEDFFDFETVYLSSDGSDARRVESCKPYKGFVYLKLSGINTPEEADKYRNKYVYVSRDDIQLEDGELLIADLIGLDVIDAGTQRVYGKITDVVNYGHYDTYVISDGEKNYMMPAVDDFIERIEEGVAVFVTPIPGLFDSETEN